MASQLLFGLLSNDARKFAKEGKGKMRTNTRKFRLALTWLTLVAILVMASGTVGADQNSHPIASPFDADPTSKAVIQGGSLLGVRLTAVGDPVDMDAALAAGADYLKHAQADVTEDNAGNGDPDVPDDPDDGGWDWRLTSPDFTHSTGASPTNIYGATAMGLYYAYLETSDATYMTAMQDAATYMIGDADIDSAADLVFLMRFQDLAGVTADIYKNAAKAKFDARITTHGTATAWAEYIRDARCPSYPNGIIAWDIGAWAVAAQMLEDRYPTDSYDYAQAADDIAEVIYQDSFNDSPGCFDIVDDAGWDPTYSDANYWWYALGISGLIDAFESADVHTGEIPGLVTLLLDCQYPGGAFSSCYGANPDDEDWQSTAYAVMSLARVNQTTYQTDINHACYWLGATQDAGSGGWVYSTSGDHYPEVGGECTAALSFGQNASEVWVDSTYTSSSCGGHLWGYDAFDNIQDGIDAVEGSTVNVAAGTYDEPVNIENFTGLTINGADKSTVIVQPTTTLPWNACGHTTNRQTAFRVVDSTGVVLQNMTVDMDLVKANSVFGFLYCDSTGTVHSNILKNLALPDASGGYYEIGSDFTAPGYSPSSRASITVSDNTFVDTGRLGLVTHWYVDATITGNTFYKTTDDFGYGAEIGGPSTAEVSDNKFYGFDTPAASDGSESAGIYIENAFTTGLAGIAKDVLVEGNEVYDCQYGMWIGNGYDNFAGDVDINVTLNNNNFYDNTDGAAWIQDEDKSNGSSVTVTGGGNTLTNNGTYGYYIYTEGDGDITVDLSGETISGHDTGIEVEDTAGGASTSSYAVAINDSCFSGNTTYGLNNTVSSLTVNAEENWWDSTTGPTHATSNPLGTGDAVSDNVDFVPWLDACSGNPTGNFQNTTTGEYYATLQDALDDAGPGESVGPVGGGTFSGGVTINTDGVVLDFGGATLGPGSHAVIVNANNFEIKNAVCDGTGGAAGDCCIWVNPGFSNLWIHDLEILDWPADGIHFEGGITNLKIVDNYIHDNGSDGIEFNATPGGSTLQIYGNAFRGNGGAGGYGINANSGSAVNNAQYNEWGAVDGPGGIGGGSGEEVSASVDYDPWVFGDLSVNAPAFAREEENFTVDIKTNAHHLYGIEFDLTFDPARLQVVSTLDGDFKGSANCSVSHNNMLGTLSYHCWRQANVPPTADDPEYDAPPEAGIVLQITFEAKAIAGSSQNTTIDLDGTSVKLGAKGGVNVFVDSVTDDTVEIRGTTTVDGVVDLQGRDDDSDAVVDPQAGPIYGWNPAAYTTGSWGTYSFSDMTDETYTFKVEMERYLDAERTVTVQGDTLDLGTVVLLGGDCNDDETINMLDATTLGPAFGSVPGDGNWVPEADINADDKVNILDAVLLGGNWGESSPVSWP